jgi:hypothetical protein
MPLFKSELQKLKEKDLTDKKCVICNKQIPYYRKEKETCNHLCAKELGRLNKKKEKIASREGKHFYCRWCKKEIIDHSKPTDYCSQSCRTSAQHETQGQVRITLTCKTCGKEFKVLKDRNTNYCSHKCMYDDITDSTTIEDIIQVATFFYKHTGVCLPKEELASQLGTTRKIIERRVGKLCDFYINLGFDYTRKNSKTADALFLLIDKEYNIKGIREKTFSTLRNPNTNARLKLDYFIPNTHIALEYNGEQHYNPNNRFNTCFKDTFKQSQFRDQVKQQWCKDNNFNLIIWKYNIPVTLENIHKTFDKFLLK